ncbi:putative acetyltransferase [Escherichia coli]|uniref:Putative acetyltransferase n=1 Tax=Escherichia coli TaxID=562 RepID=A0A376TXI7_ECOLX|nr:putative acetyltransferase [Escherichia coli]
MIREAQRSELPAILELWLEKYNLGASLYKSELLA